MNKIRKRILKVSPATPREVLYIETDPLYPTTIKRNRINVEKGQKGMETNKRRK